MVDQKLLRDACGHFVTGVTIVTTNDELGQPVGFTANAFTSVSLDPPLVLICVAETSSSYGALATGDGYAVHILHRDQNELASRFARSAGDGIDKFSEVAWDTDGLGLPKLPGAVARLSCSVVDRFPGGDHLIVVGRVHDAEINPFADPAPLAFHRGRFVNISA